MRPLVARLSFWVNPRDSVYVELNQKIEFQKRSRVAEKEKLIRIETFKGIFQRADKENTRQLVQTLDFLIKELIEIQNRPDCLLSQSTGCIMVPTDIAIYKTRIKLYSIRIIAKQPSSKQVYPVSFNSLVSLLPK